jgi:hypothetical protein
MYSYSSCNNVSSTCIAKMKRGIRPLLPVFVFISVLLLIIFLGSSSTSKPLAWSLIHYTSAVAEINGIDGVCPGLQPNVTKPVLVVARVDADGDASWLEKLSDKYHLCIYDVATSTGPPEQPMPSSQHIQHPLNRAHEALPYLTFLTSNYNLLASSSATPGVVFIHGSRFAWHNDHPVYDNLALLLSLNVSAAVETVGYANLRCDWSAGTCGSGIKAQGSVAVKLQAMTSPWDLRAVSDAALPAAFAEIFGGESESAELASNAVLRAQCCAQFAVSVDSIKQHTLEEYIALRQWLLDGQSLASKDDRVVGRILSYLWHVLFIKHESVASLTRTGGIDLGKLNGFACPESASECYCRLYGRCELQQCEQRGQCTGQYSVPKRYKLEAGWAEKYS